MQEFDQKKQLFRGCSQFKGNNVRVAPGIVLKFYTSWQNRQN